MKSKDKLIQTIIKARFGEHNDAKLYEPVSTDVLFLLKPFYSQVAMSNDGLYLMELVIALVAVIFLRQVLFIAI